MCNCKANKSKLFIDASVKEDYITTITRYYGCANCGEPQSPIEKRYVPCDKKKPAPFVGYTPARDGKMMEQDCGDGAYFRAEYAEIN